MLRTIQRSLASLGSLRTASLLLLTLPALGCGRITIPVTFGLVGDNTITLEVPFFPPGQNTFGTILVGGAEATVDIDLSAANALQLLLSPEGLTAAVTIDRINIAGDNIDIFGLHTGTICTYADPDLESGGLAFLRPIQNEADFHLTMNTLISMTDPIVLSLFPDPLPFPAQIDQEHVRVTLVDMLNLLAGKGGRHRGAPGHRGAASRGRRDPRHLVHHRGRHAQDGGGFPGRSEAGFLRGLRRRSLDGDLRESRSTRGNRARASRRPRSARRGRFCMGAEPTRAARRRRSGRRRGRQRRRSGLRRRCERSSAGARAHPAPRRSDGPRPAASSASATCRAEPSTAHANGVSANGSVIVGTGIDASNESSAFRWTTGSGLVALDAFGCLLCPSLAFGNGVVGERAGRRRRRQSRRDADPGVALDWRRHGDLRSRDPVRRRPQRGARRVFDRFDDRRLERRERRERRRSAGRRRAAWWRCPTFPARRSTPARPTYPTTRR